MWTTRELADRVRRMRKPVWDAADPTVAVVATNHLNPEDERAVRRVVAEAGVQEPEMEETVRKVSAILIGQVIGLDDNQPADGAD